MAARTPAARNRYVDFLRALAITVVIIGHWLIATAHYANGELTPGHLLKTHPQMQWLTWLFQVMPIFFIVGGYANAVSLESARRRGSGYAAWLFGRLNRLVAPLLVLLIAWAAIAGVMVWLDVRPQVIQFTSRAALIPTWFLAIYILVVMLAPAVYALWQRFGFASLAGFAALAALTDIAFFAADLRWLGVANYFWVWLAVHQLGFVWRDQRVVGVGRRLGIAAAGLAALYLLVALGPYPLAMVGSPDEGLSNTLPPKITLLALGLFQFGLLLALEPPMRRALEHHRFWTAAVLVNSMIMTLYLWHITVMVLLGSALYLAGGIGFTVEPGSTAWWLSRPLWIGSLLLLLLPTALLLSPLERRSRREGAPIPSAARQIPGAIMLCLGVASLALYGFGGGPLPHLDMAALGLVLVGAGVSGLLSAPGSGR